MANPLFIILLSCSQTFRMTPVEGNTNKVTINIPIKIYKRKNCIGLATL